MYKMIIYLMNYEILVQLSKEYLDYHVLHCTTSCNSIKLNLIFSQTYKNYVPYKKSLPQLDRFAC